MKKLNKLALASLLFLTGCNIKENINKILSKTKNQLKSEINKNSIITTTIENTPINESNNRINIEEELKKLDEEILKLSQEKVNESPFFCNIRSYIINTLKESRQKIEKGETSTSLIITQAYLDFLTEHEEEFKEYIETLENKEENNESN